MPIVPETRRERDARISASLPPLGSAAYLSLLKTATAAELPPSVLARAYRALGKTSKAGAATLDRLVGRHDQYGYLRVVYLVANRRKKALGGFSPHDLVQNAIGEIVATLSGPQGECAETGWVHYLRRCVEWAYRKMVGRDGTRSDESAGDPDAVEHVQAGSIPWHGTVAPSKMEWLEDFLDRASAFAYRIRIVLLHVVVDRRIVRKLAVSLFRLRKQTRTCGLTRDKPAGRSSHGLRTRR
ncbi:MAG: hypothetical protein ABI442_13770 [Gemmatimonadaceae bacterium]